jgi:hypothetical protein
MSNNGEQIFRIHKLDDITAYRIMCEIRDIIGATDPIHVNIARGFNVQVAAYGEENIHTGSYAIPEFIWNGIHQPNNQSVQVHYVRFARDQPSPSDFNFDTVTVRLGASPGQWQSYTEVIRSIFSAITQHETPAASFDTGKAQDTLRELMISQSANHQRMIESLSTATDDMITKRAQLDSDAKAAEARREEVHERKLAELQGEREKLELQSHMAERRRIGNSITNLSESLNGRTTLPFQARIYGLSIFLVALLGGSVSSIIAFQTVRALQIDAGVVADLSVVAKAMAKNAPMSAAEPDATINTVIASFPVLSWFLAGKALISGLIAVGSLTWAASWMKRYFDDDVRFTRNFQQFSTDVARASWVIEAIHEIKHEHKGDLPDEWVEAVTRNLFTESNQTTHLDDASLALKALMGLAGSARVGQNGVEVEIGRKGVKALGDAGS